MKTITGNTTTHLRFPASGTDRHDWRAFVKMSGHVADTFEKLQEIVAYIGYYNPGFEIFLRAQSREHLLNDGIPSIFPSIYRLRDGNHITQRALSGRLAALADVEERLLSALESDQVLPGRMALVRHQEARWALLQHYRVCHTPLVDVTRSTRVVASFALPESDLTVAPEHDRVIYICGTPYLTGNFTHNFADNLRLLNLRHALSFKAHRPHEQEGYLIGSLYDWQKATEFHNLAVRVMAKVVVPAAVCTNLESFWGAYNRIPTSILLPEVDPMKRWLTEHGLIPDSV